MRVRLVVVALLAFAVMLCVQAPAMGIHRSVVVTRGKAWLVDAVPYSQSRYHDSYRTDCSGFVSMCWALTTSSGAPLSLSTRTLPTTIGIASAIATASLLPGDIEVWPGHHTFLFVAWTDLAHTAMVSLEEGGSATGTICRVRSTAGLAAGYRPYRRKGIESDPPYAARLEMVEQKAKLPILPDRYSSAVRASAAAFTSASSVVIASADDWKNAVTAPALAGTVRGPVLFVSRDAIPASVVGEIRRLASRNAYIVGPSSVVSTRTANALAGLGLRVERVSGPDAIANSAAVAARTIQIIGKNGAGQRLWDGTLILADAADRVDIQSAASLSARKRWPLLLTTGQTLATDTRTAIDKIKPTCIVVLGGPSVVSTSTFTALKARVTTVYRLGGPTRYDTAFRIAERAVALGATWSRVGLVPEGDLVDALAGSVAQARLGTFALSTPRRSLSARVAGVIKSHRASTGKVRIFGNESAIDYRVRHAVFDVLNASP